MAESNCNGAGKLYIVATPIGNLDDITLRAIQILKEVDVIAAEDTRHSAKLLQHLDVRTPMLALHDHNEKQKAQSVIEQIKQGKSIALISDAGTPLISDPGYSLVSTARREGVDVHPIPGPSAVITALCAAGLPTDKFLFAGFLPVKQQAKQTFLQEYQQADFTLVCYESPRRIMDTLDDLEQCFGSERQIVVAKELTKHFEHFASGNADEIKAWFAEDSARLQGEMVVMVGPNKVQEALSAEASSLLKALLNELPVKKAAALTAQHYGLKKNDLYKLALEWQEQ